MQAGPELLHSDASQLTDDARRASENRAFECYRLGLYDTGLALIEALQDEHVDQITKLSAAAASYIQKIRGGGNVYTSLSADEPAFRSLGADGGGSQASGPHDSSPPNWAALEPDLVWHIFFQHALTVAAPDVWAAFLTGTLVCRDWKNALTQENEEWWRKAYFEHMYGVARGSELERVYLAEVANGQHVSTVVTGYWKDRYMKDFVQIQGYDALVKQAIAHDEKARQPDHVIEVGHVQHLINHMCNIAEKVAVAAPTPVPVGREGCISKEKKMLAHQFFNVLRMLKIPKGHMGPSQAEFDGPLFVVVRAVTDIWEAKITGTIDRIVAKVKDFSVEHKERSCKFIDEFTKSATRWLKYIDDLYASMRVERLSCATIAKREAQRLRQELSLEQAAGLQT